MSDIHAWLDAFPGILHAERVKTALTQEELAQRINTTPDDVASWEGGVSLPTLPQFFALAELFGWPIPRSIVKEGLAGLAQD